MEPIHVLALSGSLRSRSSNTALLHAAAKLANERLAISIYDGIGDLPHFNPDLDEEAAPAPVARFRAALRQADGLLICTPEYANGVPGVLKNALDWLVSSAELYAKPVAVISASPTPMGGEKAYESLLLTLGMLNAGFAGGLRIPFVSMKLDAEGAITDPDTVEAMRGLLTDLAVRCSASS
jgi:NAD(P)H-dependent FMN reductase